MGISERIYVKCVLEVNGFRGLVLRRDRISICFGANTAIRQVKYFAVFFRTRVLIGSKSKIVTDF